MTHLGKRILTLLLVLLFLTTTMIPALAATHDSGTGITSLELGKTVTDPGYGAGNSRIVTVELTIMATLPESSEEFYAGYKAVVTDSVPMEFGKPYDFMYKLGTEGEFEEDDDYVKIKSDMETGTHAIEWYVGELYTEGITLQYKMQAKAPYYGAILTNTGAFMMADLVGTAAETIEGPFSFPDPYAMIRPYAVADDYQASREVALAVAAGDGLLVNDMPANDFINDSDGFWDFTPLKVNTGDIKLPAGVPTDSYDLAVNEDGSFTFLTKESFSGDVFTFQYQTMVMATASTDPLPPNNDVSFKAVMGTMMFSDFVEVEIIVGDAFTVQKYLGANGTNPGQGFRFVITPVFIVDEESVNVMEVINMPLTNAQGRTTVTLENGEYILTEVGATGYTTSDVPWQFAMDDGMIFDIDMDWEEVPNNTYVVRNIPTSTPPPAPGPVSVTTTTTLVPLIVNVVGPGTALPGSNSYSLNSLVMFTVTPEDGASFLGWTGPDGASVIDDRILMSGARVVTANFGTEPVPAPELEPEPEEEFLPPETIPEAAPEMDDVILEEEVPMDVPALPTTSGLPIALVSLFGGLMVATGMARRKK